MARTMRFAFSLATALLSICAVGSLSTVSVMRPAEATQPLIAQTDTQPDIQTQQPYQLEEGEAELARAMYGLLTTDIYSLNSNLSIAAVGPGINFSSEVRIQTLLEKPGKLQSLIQFTDVDGRVGNEYTITSDGEQVWVYSAAQNAYSVMPFAEFRDNYRDSFLAGFLTMFVLDMPADDIDIERLSSLSVDEALADEAIVRELLSGIDDDDWIIDSELIDGKAYTLLSFSEPSDPITVTMYVNSETANIDAIVASGPIEAGELLMREDIVYSIPPVAIPEATFAFTPPDGAQLSATQISIEPF